VEVGDVGVEELRRRGAPGVERQTRMPSQPASQPREVTVASQGVVGEPQRAQPVQISQRCRRQPRQVVVVEGSAGSNHQGWF